MTKKSENEKDEEETTPSFDGEIVQGGEPSEDDRDVDELTGSEKDE